MLRDLHLLSEGQTLTARPTPESCAALWGLLFDRPRDLLKAGGYTPEGFAAVLLDEHERTPKAPGEPVTIALQEYPRGLMLVTQGADERERKTILVSADVLLTVRWDGRERMHALTVDTPAGTSPNFWAVLPDAAALALAAEGIDADAFNEAVWASYESAKPRFSAGSAVPVAVDLGSPERVIGPGAYDLGGWFTRRARLKGGR